MKKQLFLILFVIAAAMIVIGCVFAFSGYGKITPEEPSVAATAEPTPTTEPTAEPTLEPTAVPTSESSAEPVVASETELIEEIISGMTIEEKVGQLFIVRCPEKNQVQDIIDYNIGNYILFDRDFEHYSPEEVASNISSYQNAAKIPMLIGVDEEGGTVNRISCWPQFEEEEFYSPRELYALGGIDTIINVEQIKIDLLKSLGINMNFAPVCDISTDESQFMYLRSLGQDPYITADFVSRTAELYQLNGLACSLKHFPGYGDNLDTHTGSSVDVRTLESLENYDMIPFEKGIDYSTATILVSHNIVTAFDSNLPASVSPAIHDYIRNNMGFDGVILTDDLSMKAISNYFSNNAAGVMAIQAGNDLLTTTNYVEEINAILTAIQDGIITEERINESVYRILRLKYNMGLFS